MPLPSRLIMVPDIKVQGASHPCRSANPSSILCHSADTDEQVRIAAMGYVTWGLETGDSLWLGYNGRAARCSPLQASWVVLVTTRWVLRAPDKRAIDDITATANSQRMVHIDATDSTDGSTSPSFLSQCSSPSDFTHAHWEEIELGARVLRSAAYPSNAAHCLLLRAPGSVA